MSGFQPVPWPPYSASFLQHVAFNSGQDYLGIYILEIVLGASLLFVAWGLCQLVRADLYEEEEENKAPLQQHVGNKELQQLLAAGHKPYSKSKISLLVFGIICLFAFYAAFPLVAGGQYVAMLKHDLDRPALAPYDCFVQQANIKLSNVPHPAFQASIATSDAVVQLGTSVDRARMNVNKSPTLTILSDVGLNSTLGACFSGILLFAAFFAAMHGGPEFFKEFVTKGFFVHLSIASFFVFSIVLYTRAKSVDSAMGDSKYALIDTTIPDAVVTTLTFPEFASQQNWNMYSTYCSLTTLPCQPSPPTTTPTPADMCSYFTPIRHQVVATFLGNLSYPLDLSYHSPTQGSVHLITESTQISAIVQLNVLCSTTIIDTRFV